MTRLKVTLEVEATIHWCEACHEDGAWLEWVIPGQVRPHMFGGEMTAKIVKRELIE